MSSACMRASVIGLVAALCAVGARQADARVDYSAPVSETELTVVDAAQAEPGTVYATGEGAVAAPAEEPNRAKAYLQAKAYARMQATANLLQALRGTNITYRASGNGFGCDEELSQQTNGVLDGVRIVSERRKQEGKDTIVEVTVAASASALAAASSRAGAQVASTRLDPTWAKSAAPAPTTSTELTNSLRPASEEPYTAVIIDARGLGVARSMSPKIVEPGGSEVWGTVKVDYDFVSDHGIVAYARGLAEAYANARAGANPMVIRAVGRGPSPSRSDVVISSVDAEYLLSENRRSGFLDDFRVIFVVDPGRF